MKTFAVIVQKDHASTRFGLTLAQKSGSSQIMIRDVSPSGVFANTKLVPGLQILEINGKKGLRTVDEALQILKSAPVGKITVVAQGCIATAHKKDKNSKAGISLRKLTREEGVTGPAEIIIESISEKGLFANSGLQKGCRISAINGKPCPQMLNETIAMIREVVGDLTVVAVESDINKDKEPRNSLGAFLDKHHVSMGDSTFASVKTLTGQESQLTGQSSFQEEEFTIEPNSEAATARELNSMPIVQGGIVVSDDEGAGVFDSEYGAAEQEFTIEPNSEMATERMRNTPVVEREDGVIDSEYGDIPLSPSQKHLNDVTTIISKGFPGEKVGLALKNVKETKTVIVNRLMKDGLATRSINPLSVGQTILYINGQKCPPSAKRATALITEAPRTITIIARNTTVTAHKKTADAKLGITLRSSKRNPNVVVQEVAPGGLFGTTILAKGQTVVAINGMDCPDNAYSAIELLKSLAGEISIVVGSKGKQSKPRQHQQLKKNLPPIVAAYHEPEEPQIVPAVQEPENVGARSVVSNKEKGKWVGISLTKTDGMITVIKIQDTSPLNNSELKVGHAILYINDVACPDSMTEVISMIYRTSGDLLITSAPVEEAKEILANTPILEISAPVPRHKTSAPAPTRPPGQVVARITKTDKEEKIGIKVVRSLQDRIVISSITEGSLLSNSDLAPGQFIVSINGKPCPQTKEETVKLIRDAVGPVEIIASSSVGKAVKKSASTKVGISIGRTVSKEMVIVGLLKGSILEDDSPWALRKDQLVVSINGVPCPDNVQDAVGLIRKCVGELTIVAVDRPKKTAVAAQQPLVDTEKQNSPEMVPIAKTGSEKRISVDVFPYVKTDSGKESSSATKPIAKAPQNGIKSMPTRQEAAPELPDPAFDVPSPQNGSSLEFKPIRAVVPNKKEGDMLGLSFGMTQDYIFVNHIAADSPFVDTDLCVGHRLARIDGEDCPLPLSDTLELFAQHVGTMTLDAQEKIVSPGQVSASVVKKSQQASPGIGFANSDQGRVVISSIDPKGLFANSALQLGQVLELINGRSCLDAETSYETMVHASGKVTIVASATVAKVVKQEIDQSAGIVLGQSQNGRDVIVKAIEESGLFGKSGLIAGQRVISIAGISCPSSPTEAEGLIQDCVGDLSIVAVDTLDKYCFSSMENGNGYTQKTDKVVTVSVYKENPQSKVGMKMRKGIQEGKVMISGLDENGPVGGKGIEVGMHIISIDGVPCPPDPKTATGIIKKAKGHFEIIASPTIASILKKTKDEKLGVTLSRTPQGDLVVHSIASTSSFKGTDLQVGQKIVAINGQNCNGRLDEAIRKLAESDDMVTIIALDTLKT